MTLPPSCPELTQDNEVLLDNQRFIVTTLCRPIYPQKGRSYVQGYYAHQPQKLITLSFTDFWRRSQLLVQADIGAYFKAHPVPVGNWTVLRYIDTTHVEIKRIVTIDQLKAWSRGKSKSKSKSG